jgi:hypothetical protein
MFSEFLVKNSFIGEARCFHIVSVFNLSSVYHGAFYPNHIRFKTGWLNSWVGWYIVFGTWYRESAAARTLMHGRRHWEERYYNEASFSLTIDSKKTGKFKIKTILLEREAPIELAKASLWESLFTFRQWIYLDTAFWMGRFQIWFFGIPRPWTRERSRQRSN